jgi:energy-coupling factor transporter transmembrane protein EcfT
MESRGASAARRPIRLRRRRADWILLAFFAVNLIFIAYLVDIEQLTIAAT